MSAELLPGRPLAARRSAGPRALSRRGVLRGASALAGAALAGPLAAACAAPARDTGGTSRVILTQAVNSLAYAQNYIAKAMGYYFDAHLNVETVVTDGGGPDVQAVLAGTAEFTINDGAQVLTALKSNRRLVAVAATFGRCLVNATMSAKTARRLGITDRSPFEKRVAALQGLRIGVTAPGALTWQIARFNLRNAGFDPDRDAKIVALGGGAAVLAALEKDQVDVIYISVPFGETAVARGSGVTLIDHSAGDDPNLPSFMMEGLWVTPQTLEREGDDVQAMVSALNRASEFLATRPVPDVVAALRADFPNFPPEVMTAAVAKLRSAVAVEGRWDDQAMSVTRGVLDKNGLLPAGSDTDRIFDARFL